MLGKRDRETTVIRRAKKAQVSSPASNAFDDESHATDVFRQYFEAKFDPLPESRVPASSSDSDDVGDPTDDRQSGGDEDTATESDWSGISENVGEVSAVEVIEHTGTNPRAEDDPIGKVFQKTFMSSKPPRSVSSVPKSGQLTTAQDEDEDEIETQVNLKHDLDLQRLLRESHLLEQTKKRPDGGAQRHKATDLRLQSLGSRASLFTQEKMPMSHRKGIRSKVSTRESHRRKEAKENGVILEKASHKTAGSSRRRDRGVDVPVVGKFKGGTLQLSRKDVASIQGPRRTGSKRGRR